MYWHRLLEEYFNRYAEGLSFHYLPKLESEDQPIAEQVSHIPPQSRIMLAGGHYLTLRESQCVHWMLQGMTMREVAVQLALSPRTVEYYLKRMKERLGCENKKSLMAFLTSSDGIKDIHEDVSSVI
jgi:DNA-binding CsgD family transcriptional regulator